VKGEVVVLIAFRTAGQSLQSSEQETGNVVDNVWNV